MTEETASGVREHFGHGRLALDPAKTVFINCPFDKEYAPTFDAIVFAVACCGFTPRCAAQWSPGIPPCQEWSGSSEPSSLRIIRFMTCPAAVRIRTPARVLAELPRFMEEKAGLQAEWRDKAPWADIVGLAFDAADRLQ